jgi:type I restriction enzyme S subunit
MFGNVINNEKGWPSMQLGEIAESRLGKMLDSKKQTGQSRRQYLRNANVQWAHFELNEVFEMDFDEREITELRLRKGDILVCEGGEIGRSAIWNDELPECYFQKALHRIRVNRDKVLPEYLLYLFWYFSTHNGFEVAHASTIAHITGVMLKKMMLPVPPISLQSTFSDFVRRVQNTGSKQEESSKDIDMLFDSLMHKAFRGALELGQKEGHDPYVGSVTLDTYPDE